MFWIFDSWSLTLEMIAHLHGKISYLRDNCAIVDIGGVGYKVHITLHTLGKIASAQDVEFFTHTYVREDTLSLYGFLELEELEMFELLISISGIGPKAALGILSIADPKMIRAAVLNKDSSVLTRVSGVGKKIAERVILELKNKVVDMPTHERAHISADNDAFDALVSMGYSASEIREMLKDIPAGTRDAGERVRLALKNFGKRNR